MNTHDLINLVEEKLYHVADLNQGQLDRKDIKAALKSVEWKCPEYIEPNYPSWYTFAVAFALGGLLVFAFVK